MGPFDALCILLASRHHGVTDPKTVHHERLLAAIAGAPATVLIPWVRRPRPPSSSDGPRFRVQGPATSAGRRASST